MISRARIIFKTSAAGTDSKSSIIGGGTQTGQHTSDALSSSASSSSCGGGGATSSSTSSSTTAPSSSSFSSSSSSTTTTSPPSDNGDVRLGDVSNRDPSITESEENTWPNLDALLSDQISEIVNKWRQIDDEIWSKIVCFERNRRIAKAYARSQIISITGSEQGFDGFRIGLNGFPNMRRDSETERIKHRIQSGLKLKIDGAGNVFVKRVGSCPVFVGGPNCVGIRAEPLARQCDTVLSPSSHTTPVAVTAAAAAAAVSSLKSAHPPASRFAPLEQNRAQQIFDMRHFERAVNEFCASRRPQAMLEQLHRGCLHAIQFGVVEDRSSARVLQHPCWIVLINIVALDLLWSRLGDQHLDPQHQSLLPTRFTHAPKQHPRVLKEKLTFNSTATPLCNQNKSKKSDKHKNGREKIQMPPSHHQRHPRVGQRKNKGVDDLYYSGYFAKTSYQSNGESVASSKLTTGQQQQPLASQQQVGQRDASATKKKNTTTTRSMMMLARCDHDDADHERDGRWFGRSLNDRPTHIGATNNSNSSNCTNPNRQMFRRHEITDDDDDDEDGAEFEFDRHRHRRHRRNSSSALLSDVATRSSHHHHRSHHHHHQSSGNNSNSSTHNNNKSKTTKLHRISSCSALHHLGASSSSFDARQVKQSPANHSRPNAVRCLSHSEHLQHHHQHHHGHQHSTHPSPQQRLNSNGNSSATSDSIDSSLVSSESSLLSSPPSSSSSSADDIPHLMLAENGLKASAPTTTTSGCCRHRLYRTRAQTKALLSEGKLKGASNLIASRKQFSSNIELRSFGDNEMVAHHSHQDMNHRPHHLHHPHRHQQQQHHHHLAEHSKPSTEIFPESNGFNQRLGRLLLLQQQHQHPAPTSASGQQF